MKRIATGHLCSYLFAAGNTGQTVGLVDHSLPGEWQLIREGNVATVPAIHIYTVLHHALSYTSESGARVNEPGDYLYINNPQPLRQADRSYLMLYQDIVANGAQRIRTSEEYYLKEAKIRAAAASKYQTELKDANLFQRVIIRFIMWREIRRELEKIAPDYGFYLKP